MNEKQAIFSSAKNWLVNRGNQYVTDNFDSMMLDPEKRKTLFAQAAGQPTPSSWLSYFNPMSYVRSIYASDPRAKAHIQSTFQQRLRDPAFVSKLFGSTQGTMSALGNTASTVFSGVNPLTYASNPSNWAAAFGGGDQAAKNRLHSLSTLYSSFTPTPAKTASAGIKLPGGITCHRTASGAFVCARPNEEVDEEPKSQKTLANLQEEVGAKARSQVALLRPPPKADLAAAALLKILPDGLKPPSLQGFDGIKAAMWTPPQSTAPVFASTSFDTKDHTTPVNRMLQQHFSYRHARDELAKDPNISLVDKAKILTAMKSSNKGKSSGTVKFRDFLPSLVGAGVGYAGATVVGSMLNLTPSKSKAFRVGGMILGSLLNNPKVV